jgi:lipopolysaccharide transport system permease protein
MAKNKSQTNQEVETVTIKPGKGWVSLNLKDLWRFRELALFLTWRDIKVRYQQTILGAAWAIIQPLSQMLVFNFLFGNIAEIGTDGIPRPIFTFSALLPWNLFAKALQDASRSLVKNKAMITKVYFPRLLIPLSSVLSGLADFLVAFVILIGMMFYFHVPINNAVYWLPIPILLAVMLAYGVGLWFSAWNLHYRDVAYFIPFLSQLWLFATPVMYPLSEIDEKWKLLYSLNPMTGIVEWFRYSLLNGSQENPILYIEGIWVSAIIIPIILISGLFYFRRMERTFADKI